MTTDILFTSVPYTDTVKPLMAPGLLKAIAKSHGFSAIGIDLNQELVKMIGADDKLVHFFCYNHLYLESVDRAVELINYAADRILSYNTKMVGLSLLTTGSQTFTKWLCTRIKQLSPDTVIIIGGAGIKGDIASMDFGFCEGLRQRKIIDYYITGDADVALGELLKGNITYPGINSPDWIQITNLEDMVISDFDDYDFTQYSSPIIPIVDSRGCIRTCEFCDVIEHWTKFVVRSAESVFEEMKFQAEKYKIFRFSMKNSVTNGNMNEFKKLMRLMAAYNDEHPDQQMTWEGYFIIRGKKQHPPELWELLGKTGAMLFLGIESVIERVRKELGKPFSNEDIDYHLDMAKQYNVKLMGMIQIGYPRETFEDYEFTKQWLKERVPKYGYFNDGPLVTLMLSNTIILENTKLEREAEKLSIKNGKYRIMWVKEDSGITLEDRIKHDEEVREICAPLSITGVKSNELKKFLYS